jgi:hypothetical protein
MEWNQSLDNTLRFNTVRGQILNYADPGFATLKK